jgi:anti-sigma factor RsiW
MPEKRTSLREIEALVDGQLPPARAAQVQSLLSRHPPLQNHYKHLFRQNELLRLWWQSLPEDDRQG